MKKIILTVFILGQFILANAQPHHNKVERPKLIVGLVIDQMRWDYLYRYYDRYTEGGFKRLLNDGFTCENTYINYLPSSTAPGHSTIYTGSVPAFHGIVGNDWIDPLTNQIIYCTEDSLTQPLGTTSSVAKMSPHYLLASTITDELRLATNFESQVIGISLKDRASILPAGHMANGAFWFDDATGNFVTSTYYMKELPEWVKNFNNKNEPQALMNTDWNTLYPLNSYTSSDSKGQIWEGKFTGEQPGTFPHHMPSIYKQNKGSFRTTPFGNTLTLDFAKAAINGYRLGKGKATDFLAINCASTDYVGHMFGPTSIEIEDTYLRLDKDLASFFLYLDQNVGKGNYMVFLTADHGAAHSVNYLKQHHIPAGFLNVKGFVTSLNQALAVQFNVPNLVSSITNFHIHYDNSKMKNQNYEAIKKATIDFLDQQPGIEMAIDIENIGSAPVPLPLKQMIINGYYKKRTGPIIIIPEPGWMDGYTTGTTHGNWNAYDTHIPLLFMGWHIPHGTCNRTIQMTDIAPTLSALLHIQMPNSCVGVPIDEIMKARK